MLNINNNLGLKENFNVFIFSLVLIVIIVSSSLKSIMFMWTRVAGTPATVTRHLYISIIIRKTLSHSTTTNTLSSICFVFLYKMTAEKEEVKKYCAKASFHIIFDICIIDFQFRLIYIKIYMFIHIFSPCGPIHNRKCIFIVPLSTYICAHSSNPSVLCFRN